MLVDLVDFIAVDYRVRHQILNPLASPCKHLKSTANNKNNASKGNVQNTTSTNDEWINSGRVFARNAKTNSKSIRNINPHDILVELDEEEEDKVDAEGKIRKMQNKRKVKMIAEETLELEERFDAELVTVKTLEQLIQDSNNNHV